MCLLIKEFNISLQPEIKGKNNISLQPEIKGKN